MFESFSDIAIKLLGNSITFIIALVLVFVYLLTEKFYQQNIHEIAYDIILCVTFLGFFIIQKSFNKFSTSLHLKINELVASNENASNKMVNIEKKTEEELSELEKQYSLIADMATTSDDVPSSISIEILKNIKNKENGKEQDNGA